MAREKGQKQRTKKPRSAGETRENTGKRSSVWASRLRAVAILLVVGGVAIFSGYTVGNYVMGWFFGSNDEPTRVATSGTNVPPGSGNTTSNGPTSGGPTSVSDSSSNTVPGTTAPSTTESEMLYRVRVGAYATREEAEPDLQTLAESGYSDAYVVKSDDGTAYHIQVGAFSTSRSAFDVEERLRTAGFTVYIETVQRR